MSDTLDEMVAALRTVEAVLGREPEWSIDVERKTLQARACAAVLWRRLNEATAGVPNIHGPVLDLLAELAGPSSGDEPRGQEGERDVERTRRG